MDDLQEQLHRALQARDEEATANALAIGADPNQEWPERSRTPLAHAAEVGPPAIVAQLLAHGADPDPEPLPGRRLPLELAVGSRDALAKVELLLAAGADPSRGIPLVIAAERGGSTSRALAAQLLAAGAGVDQRCPSSGFTALTHAVYSDHVALVELLLEHGARADLPIRYDACQGQLSPGITAHDIAHEIAQDSKQEAIAELARAVGLSCTWDALQAVASAFPPTRAGVLEATRTLARDLADEATVELLDSEEIRPLLEEIQARRGAAAGRLATAEALLALLQDRGPSVQAHALSPELLIGTWSLITASALSRDGDGLEHLVDPQGDDGGTLRFDGDGSVWGQLQDEWLEGRWALQDGRLSLQLDAYAPHDVSISWDPRLSRLNLSLSHDGDWPRSYGLELRTPESPTPGWPEELVRALATADPRAAVWCAAQCLRSVLPLLPGRRRPEAVISAVEAWAQGRSTEADEVIRQAVAAPDDPFDPLCQLARATVVQDRRQLATAAAEVAGGVPLLASHATTYAIEVPSAAHPVRRARSQRQHAAELRARIEAERWPRCTPTPEQLRLAAAPVAVAWDLVQGHAPPARPDQSVLELLAAHERATRLGLDWSDPVARAVAEQTQDEARVAALLRSAQDH